MRQKSIIMKMPLFPHGDFFLVFYSAFPPHKHKSPLCVWPHVARSAFASAVSTIQSLPHHPLTPPYYHPAMPAPLGPISRASRGNRFSASDSSINSNVSAATCHHSLPFPITLSQLSPTPTPLCVSSRFATSFAPLFLCTLSTRGGLMVRAARRPKDDGLLAAFLVKFIKCILQMHSSPRSAEYC